MTEQAGSGRVKGRDKTRLATWYQLWALNKAGRLAIVDQAEAPVTMGAADVVLADVVPPDRVGASRQRTPRRTDRRN